MHRDAPSTANTPDPVHPLHEPRQLHRPRRPHRLDLLLRRPRRSRRLPQQHLGLPRRGYRRLRRASTGPGANDTDNPACGVRAPTRTSSRATSRGYITIDVVNFCTNRFPTTSPVLHPSTPSRRSAGTRNGGPNVLMGDTFFIDPADPGGNISGDPIVSLEFDARLDWTRLERPSTTVTTRRY